MSGRGGRGGGGGGRGSGDRGRGGPSGGGFRGGRGGGRGGGVAGAEVHVFRDPNSPAPAPDVTLMGIEDKFTTSNKSLAGAMEKASLSQHLPGRPGYGTQGKKILVYANYFKVSVPPSLNLTRYNVEVTPEAKGKKLGRVFQLLLEMTEFSGVATEWKSMIITLAAPALAVTSALRARTTITPPTIPTPPTNGAAQGRNM